MPAENTNVVVTCANCNREVQEGTKICKACNKCRRCRNHYRCSTKHRKITHHCPEFKPQCKICLSCEKSCKCWECSGCNKAYRSIAITGRNGYPLAPIKACSSKDGCGKCPTCCKCIKCGTCQKIFKSTKDDEFCNYCRSCATDCRCPAVAMYNEAYGERARPTFLESKLFKDNPSKRFLSAEIEVAGCNKKRPKAVNSTIEKYHAAIKHDGSLPTGGFEINTSPANGDKWIEQIVNICDSLKQQDGFVTNACGLHIHIDARDFGYTDLRKLAILYAKAEDELYLFAEAGRKNGTYCRPCGKYYLKNLADVNGTKDAKDRLIQNIIRGQGDGYSGGRYHGLNLHSFFIRKTVECRILHGTLDPDLIVNWGMLWAGLLDYSKNHSDLEIESLTLKGWDLLKEVAPNALIKKWIEAKEGAFPTKSKAIPKQAVSAGL